MEKPTQHVSAGRLRFYWPVAEVQTCHQNHGHNQEQIKDEPCVSETVEFALEGKKANDLSLAKLLKKDLQHIGGRRFHANTQLRR